MGKLFVTVFAYFNPKSPKQPNNSISTHYILSKYSNISFKANYSHSKPLSEYQ